MDLIEILETPLSEEEVRLLCEERWRDIIMLLKENDKLVRYVRASKLEALMLTRSSRSPDGMKRWIKAKEDKDETCAALSDETRKAIEDDPQN